MQRHLLSSVARSVAVGLLLSATASAQYAERPDLVGSGSPAVDASGRSIKNMRVRAIHTTDDTLQGGTAYLIRRDPYLAYQLGRNLNFREFRDRDGVFSQQVAQLAGPMPDGTTAKITANNQTSCLGCHNLPSGNPGGGTNFSKDSGSGRNAPHYYGAGIMEMLAQQVRTELLIQLDADGSGWVSAQEAANAGSAFARTRPGGPLLSFGDPVLDGGLTGRPALNNIVRVWFVDAQGVVVPGATHVDGVTTFGYGFTLDVWGWGQGPGRHALNPTNRAFLWDPFNAHSGLQAFDPSTLDDPEGDGVSVPTLAGALQFPATHRAPDTGLQLDPLGFSRDDPDGDGFLTELSEGDLDLGEWFMLHAPRPAFAGTAQQEADGRALFEGMGCAVCHVPDWTIRAADARFPGDRRVFDLDVTWNAAAGRLEGRLVRLANQVGGRVLPRHRAFEVRGLYSDLRHHDLGPDSAELDFGGSVNSLWRTPPLWGVGSGFPWHHDGASLTLDDSIRRHGAEALAARAAYLAASAGERQALIDFLERLVLYDIESLPTDVDGDNQIAADFAVAGVGTGVERFNAEWLFRHPVQIQGVVPNHQGVSVLSCAAMNLDIAYGQQLPLRRDSDGDGWPDVWDHAPQIPGYHSGDR